MDLHASTGLSMQREEFPTLYADLTAMLAQEDRPEIRLALGLVTYMNGRFDESELHLRQAYLEFQRTGRPRRAALAATHLGRLEHIGYGNLVVAAGWFARAHRWLEGDEHCAERGWLALGLIGCSVTDAIELHRNGELALRLGRELRDADLECRALADYGLALVDMGDYARGMAHIDESMAMVRSGECTNYFISAQAQCCFVSACERAGDLPRLEGWYSAAEREYPQMFGLDAGPSLLATHCRTDYASLLCLAGRWQQAEAELRVAVQNSENMHSEHRKVSRAALADLRISQGRLHEAAELLRGIEIEDATSVPVIRLYLARGEFDLAAVRCREALQAYAGDVLRGSRFLELLVLAELGRERVDAADAVARELDESASRSGRAPVIGRAAVSCARVALARNDAAAARAVLERAIAALRAEPWTLLLAELQLELARVLEDVEPSAAVEAARRALAVFSPIGSAQRYAAQELLTRLGAPADDAVAHPLDALTPREREILALIAQGMSNPQIATTLVIAPKTAEHHVGAILRKLGLRSRSEAAVYAATLN